MTENIKEILNRNNFAEKFSKNFSASNCGNKNMALNFIKENYSFISFADVILSVLMKRL